MAMRLVGVLTVLFGCTWCLGASPEPGLLFYLSGDNQFTADYAAGGDPNPSFLRGVSVIADGAKGKAFQCEGSQQFAYWAPGSIYAQRGTLAFSWRSREPVGPTEFPIFRVAYADHSSWDMVWLRIDYNGHGFDAFVTDVNLARTRVSVTVQPFPKPNEWTHLAFSWDETRGIRFYLNGKLAATKETVAVYDAGLDQFGPHSRIISPHQVQSDYNFIRGGDIDEIRIYDRMLSDENIASLAMGDAPANIPALPPRSLNDPRWRDEWNTRYGFNATANVPPYFDGPNIGVRKVEIHDAFDLKRWWWKANDGIRETTWPGVYNRSRLPGRNDYFQLPDWDCYVESGKSITFVMPDEPWNHVEISGSAWGKMELLKAGAANDGAAESVLFERPKGIEKTINHLATPITGRKIRFTNVEQEEPISELSVYNVTNAREPAGTAKVAFKLSAAATSDDSLAAIQTFIKNRFAEDERSTLIAQPLDSAAAPAARPAASSSLPLVHILIPDTWDNIDGGLDGIAIDLPALPIAAVRDGLIPLNIQVKDPLWAYRDMLDFTFSVKPNEAKTLWLDVRDRILPAGKPFYLTIASAGGDFNASMLEGTQIRIVFKAKDAAKPEHEIDRFTQARDSYAMLVEEHPRSPKLNLWNRFEADINDLMRVNPNHNPGRNYAAVYNIVPRPTYSHPAPPEGVPAWAQRQVELLARIKHFVEWYIDNRQVDFGDFGGGLSDDTDLTNTWPGVALMGVDPVKLTDSLRRELDACYKNGMFTRGLPTIQVDELHSYEEGINCIAQNLILDYGNPKTLERAMETARGIESITGINAAGHRHIKTSYYSATKMAQEGPWGWAKPYSYLVLQTPQLLVDFNGNPEAKKYLLELTDGLLAHRRADGNGRGSIPAAIQFETDQEGALGRGYFPWHVFWTAWKWTGDAKYLAPLTDGGSLNSVNANTLDILRLRGNQPNAAPAGARGGRGGAGTAAWQTSGDKSILERLYASQIDECDFMDYINTEGSLWIDRVSVPINDIQRARLGGIALVRNSLFPGHTVSWKFDAPANDRSVAILIPDATPTSFKVIAYNLETIPVRAKMTGWYVEPGMWDITQGIDTNDDDVADRAMESRSSNFERSSSIAITLPPRATTVLTMKLKTPGVPYWQRPDIGISLEDVIVQGRNVSVTVHSLGSVDAPASTLALMDKSGKTLATAPIPAIKAPVDLLPKNANVTIPLPAGVDPSGCSVVIDPDAKLTEITRLNNRVGL
jgi:hypothetical protein